MPPVQAPERETTKKRRGRLTLSVILAAIPAAVLLLYYIFRSNEAVMNAVSRNFSTPVRNFAAMITSVPPLRYISAAELLCAAAILWLVLYAVRIVISLIRDSRKLAGLGRRLAVIAIAALYVWSGFSVLWDAEYYSAGFSERSGLYSSGASMADLTAVTRRFADEANLYAAEVPRDADGHFAASRGEIFALSTGLYNGISQEFPFLAGTVYPPKSLMISKIMSYTGFTGFYFAFTGESNINTDAPLCLMPATIAHEFAHQHGISYEAEANFTGIAACVTSGIPIYEYSGWLMGLIYLSNALYDADRGAYNDIMGGLNDCVLRDLRDNSEYWTKMQTSSAAAAAVNTVYDSYLKSNGQSLGIKSYGACVDLLVAWSIPMAEHNRLG